MGPPKAFVGGPSPLCVASTLSLTSPGQPLPRDCPRGKKRRALMAVLRKLDEFRGESRFTTWAYKFALLEAAVKVRHRAWQGREIPLEEEGWAVLADVAAPVQRHAEDAELFGALREEIARSLT